MQFTLFIKVLHIGDRAHVYLCLDNVRHLINRTCCQSVSRLCDHAGNS